MSRPLTLTLQAFAFVAHVGFFDRPLSVVCNNKVVSNLIFSVLSKSNKALDIIS